MDQVSKIILKNLLSHIQGETYSPLDQPLSKNDVKKFIQNFQDLPLIYKNAIIQAHNSKLLVSFSLAELYLKIIQRKSLRSIFQTLYKTNPNLKKDNFLIYHAYRKKSTLFYVWVSKNIFYEIIYLLLPTIRFALISLISLLFLAFITNYVITHSLSKLYYKQAILDLDHFHTKKASAELMTSYNLQPSLDRITSFAIHLEKNSVYKNAQYYFKLVALNTPVRHKNEFLTNYTRWILFLLKLHHIDQASKALSQAQSEYPSSISLLYLKGLIYENQPSSTPDSLNKALTLYLHCLHYQPTLLYLASCLHIYKLQGNIAAGFPLLKSYFSQLKITNKGAFLFNDFAFTFFHNFALQTQKKEINDYNMVLPFIKYYLKKLVDLNGHNPYTLYNLSLYYKITYSKNDSLKYLFLSYMQTAVPSFNMNNTLLYLLSLKDIGQHFQQIQSYGKAQNYYSLAIHEYFSHVYGNLNHTHEMRKFVAQLYKNTGDLFYFQNSYQDWDLAHHFFNLSYQIFPSDARLNYKLGVITYSYGNYRLTEQHWLKCILLFALKPFFLYDQAGLFFHLKEYSLACSHYQWILKFYLDKLQKYHVSGIIGPVSNSTKLLDTPISDVSLAINLIKIYNNLGVSQLHQSKGQVKSPLYVQGIKNLFLAKKIFANLSKKIGYLHIPNTLSYSYNMNSEQKFILTDLASINLRNALVKSDLTAGPLSTIIYNGLPLDENSPIL